MDYKKYNFSFFRENNVYQNNPVCNTTKNINKHKFLNLPKFKSQNKSFQSKKTNDSFNIDAKSPKEINLVPKLIHDQVKEYELHPHRQFNLKLIGEDIKYKLFEMNIENSLDNIHNQNKIRKSLTSGAIDDKFYEKITSNKNIIQENDSENKNDIEKKKQSRKQFYIPIPQLKLKKKKKKYKKETSTQRINKCRKLQKINNLCDSNDDDETGEENDFYVINPETTIILILDFMMIFCFVYYFIYTTFNLLSIRCFCPSEKTINFTDLILLINDLLCILDLILSFFRCYYNYEFKLIKSNKLILKFYLKYDFIFDLLSAIPIFSISKYICLKGYFYPLCFRYEMPNKFLFLKLCSILKSVKVRKILDHKKNQAFDKFLELISDNYTIERTVTTIIYTLKYIGIFHCIVCLHIFIGAHSYSNWLISTGSQDNTIFGTYISSLYFIMTTLTTVGYGDIVCQSLIERIFQIIILAIGSVFYPFVVSSIGNFVKNDSAAKMKLNNNMAMLEDIRRSYPNVSFKLYNKIYNYIESNCNSMEKYDIKNFIEDLPFTMKNSILFAMYRTTITNFKFFKNNNNSVFTAEVLTNFIPSISKKNEFLAHEGEMLEEILFLKDGKIAVNAALNIGNPMKSINKYFTEAFTPFTTEEEKKLINENINNNTYFSTLGEMTYDRAKNKLNNAFNNLGSDKSPDNKSQFKIHTRRINDDNNYNNTNNDNSAFDIKGGAIINDEGNYEYIKILDIRKNEHFGCVFMTLNKPCPLSLQIKSKSAELFLLKKENAVNLSKNYPNIWRKIYQREFHNLRKIKTLTFNVLKKYLEIKEIYVNNNNMADLKVTNNISSYFDLNLLEKSAFNLDKSMKKPKNQINNLSKQEIEKNNTLNYEYDKRSKNLNIIKTKLNSKAKKKFNVKRNSTYDDKLVKISYENKLNLKQALFLNNMQSSKNNNIPEYNSKYNDLNNKVNDDVNNIPNREVKEENKNIKLYELKKRKEKLKKIEIFLIDCKNYLNNNPYKSDNNDQNISNIPIKSILKRRSPQLNEIKNKFANMLNKSVGFSVDANKEKSGSSNKNITSNNNNKYYLNEKLFKDLENICEEETNFLENDYNINELSIDKNTDFIIKSSYPNMNEISKGKYIQDIHFQKKLKYTVGQYYKFKDKQKESNINSNLSISQDNNFESSINSDENNIKNKVNDKIKKNHRKTSPEIYSNTFYGTNNLNKMKNRKKIVDDMSDKFNKTEINQRNSVKTKKLLTNDIEINNNNLDLFTTYNIQNQNLSDIQNNEIKDNDSLKANDSINSSLPENFEEIEYEQISDKDSFDMEIKKDLKNKNNTEINYAIDKGSSKKNINVNMNKNKNLYNKINYRIYHKKKKKMKNNTNINPSNFNGKNNTLINQMLGIKIPQSSIITNNIITTSSNIKDTNKNEFNSVEKIKGIENVSIYNIIQKNINKNLNIVDKNENDNQNNFWKGFCSII